MSCSVKLYIQYLYVYSFYGTLRHLGTKRLQSNNLVSLTSQSDKTRCMLKDILIFHISNFDTLQSHKYSYEDNYGSMYNLVKGLFNLIGLRFCLLSLFIYIFCTLVRRWRPCNNRSTLGDIYKETSLPYLREYRWRCGDVAVSRSAQEAIIPLVLYVVRLRIPNI